MRPGPLPVVTLAAMSNRAPDPIPLGTAVPDAAAFVPAGVPVDAAGNSLIPELAGRTPTHNESVLINGDTVAMASSNVNEIWWKWDERRLFVSFLDGSLYAYEGVSLAVAVGMIETDSPGRYVWNALRDKYPYQRLTQGTGKHRPPQVVRLINK